MSVSFQRTEGQKGSIKIGEHEYQGDAIILEQLARLPKREFNSVADFVASLEVHAGIKATSEKTIEAVSHIFNKQVQEVVEKILSTSGSKHEIRAIFAELPQNNVPFLMAIATNLARRGAAVKANHLFSLIPLNAEEMDSCFLRMGKANLESGTTPISLSAAYHYFSCIKYNSPAPMKELEGHIQEVMTKLETLPGSRDALTLIKIREGVGNKKVASEEELNHLRLHDPELDAAFNRAEAYQRQVDREALAPPGTIVSVERAGKSLPIHIHLTGQRREGEPLVILEGGLGCISSDWQRVQTNLPPNIQVMSYDRAGMGWSGKTEEKPTAESSLAILEALLNQPELKPPYIFVGHSYGGFLGQLFTIRHPDQIKGLILVDSAIEGHMPGGAHEKRAAFDYLPPAARNSIFQNDRAHEFDEATSATVNAVTMRSEHVKTYDQEFNEFANNSRLMERAITKIPAFSCPLKVITATLENIEGNLIEDQPRWDNWTKKQAQLVLRSSQSEQIHAKKSDHFIMYHEPELIIAQIRHFFPPAKK